MISMVHRVESVRKNIVKELICQGMMGALIHHRIAKRLYSLKVPRVSPKSAVSLRISTFDGGFWGGSEGLEVVIHAGF